ncbi:MAG: hypothetical protein KAU41_08205, partial [Deltaproteobacteria bacterium]|nr:hypothetical protein [Deltaproteobacteria bacterium]
YDNQVAISQIGFNWFSFMKLSPPFFLLFFLLINLTTFLWSHDAVSRHAIFELSLTYTQY